MMSASDQYRSKPPSSEHPWPTGHIFHSPGSQFGYRVVGPCCQLFDREQLPWPCCRISWHSKEPSWRRIGRRLIADTAARRYPSYCVELIGYGQTAKTFVITLYTVKLSSEDQAWWYSRSSPQGEPLAAATTQAEATP